jgi:hypothetical protein
MVRCCGRVSAAGPKIGRELIGVAFASNANALHVLYRVVAIRPVLDPVTPVLESLTIRTFRIHVACSERGDVRTGVLGKLPLRDFESQSRNALLFGSL